MLDAPELMWAEPHLEPVYAAVRSYLEIGQRVELLTGRLDVIAGKIPHVVIVEKFLTSYRSARCVKRAGE